MSEETAVAATFPYRHEAEFAHATLQAAGIESVVLADDAGGAYAGMSFSSEIRLLVRTEDLQAARDVLADAPASDDDAPPGSDV